jgi:hypothetical protein
MSFPGVKQQFTDSRCLVRSHEANALKDHPKPLKIFSREPIYDWRILVGILCATCVGILMRSLFRIAEYAGGCVCIKLAKLAHNNIHPATTGTSPCMRLTSTRWTRSHFGLQ